MKGRGSPARIQGREAGREARKGRRATTGGVVEATITIGKVETEIVIGMIIVVEAIVAKREMIAIYEDNWKICFS